MGEFKQNADAMLRKRNGSEFSDSMQVIDMEKISGLGGRRRKKW